MGHFSDTWIAHDKRVAPYVWGHRWIGWANSAFGLFLLVALLISYQALHLEWRIENRFESDYVVWLIYFGLLAGVWEILSFPASFLHYRVERKFGLSKQSVRSWLWDKVKGWLVGSILGAIVLSLLYWCVNLLVPWWWAVAATLLVGFSIVLAQLAPVLLIPIFFKLRPMEGGSLKDRLLALCTRYGVEVKDVYHLGLGEKTEKGNAAFVGIGRTKRILIGDTLYEKYPADEVEAVFAHELGHQVHNDLWKGIFFSTFWIYLAFYAANFLATAYVYPIQETSPSRPYGMFIFLLILTLVQWPAGVFQAFFSRWREREADRFAASKIGAGAKLADALERLTFQNFGQFRPNAILEFLTYSHPAPWRRITKLRPSSFHTT